ncbi:MAG: hypothetical protein HQK64_04325 [Desulfamplus sp.]|nr:hypothetical protein [Desulfamplus sp.]MBF0388561.1 hypothetical protein [Desulfamplus sp.]
MSLLSIEKLDKMLEVMESDLSLISSSFQIMSSKEQLKLSNDIKYLLLDNIAQKIRFVFYDVGNRDDILCQYIYNNNGFAQKPHFFESSFDRYRGETIAFDVFIDFTDSFLSLKRQDRDILLNNTEYDWFV